MKQQPQEPVHVLVAGQTADLQPHLPPPFKLHPHGQRPLAECDLLLLDARQSDLDQLLANLNYSPHHHPPALALADQPLATTTLEALASFATTADLEAGLLPSRILIARNHARSLETMREETTARMRRRMRAERMESVGQLGAGMAHDFNNLFTSILGHTHIMMDDMPPDSPMRAGAEEVLKAAERATRMNRDLLTFSLQKLDQKSCVNFHELLKRETPALHELLGNDHLLEIHPHAENSSIWADASMLREALRLLLTNARESFTEACGAVTLRTSQRDLDEDDALQHGLAVGPYLAIEITDTGCGIDTQQREHIFDPFFSTKGVDHTGLGLATVFGVIEGHNGLIEARPSASGHGTTFFILLPLYQNPTIAADEENPQSPKVGYKETILVVDDERAILNITSKHLEALGYRTHTAIDGMEAIDIVTQNPNIDLVITDMVMPRMDGTRVAECLRALKPDLRILYTSGYAKDIIDTGSVDLSTNFIAKPFNRDSLAAIVRKILDDDI